MTPVGRSGAVWAALAALGVLTTVRAPDARADPSIWTAALEPAAAERQRARDEADELLARARELRRTSAPLASRRSLARKLVARLDAVDAGRASDPLLRYRYGQAEYELYDATGEAEALLRATTAFAAASKRPAPMLLRAEALNDLAICYARLHAHADEIRTYDAALAIEPHDETRATLQANRAEALMYEGKLRAAEAGYRDALHSTPHYAYAAMAATTHWGLAVALDRSGDLVGAFEHVGLARSIDPGDAGLRSTSWFFVPDHDAHWYAALGYWHAARATRDLDDRLSLYRDAVEAWTRYLDLAPETDRWLPLAEVRRRQCEREGAEAQRDGVRPGDD